MKWREPEIEALAEGSTGQTELSRVRLGQAITIPDYDKTTQRVIGETLRSLDDKIELNNRINENLAA
jgi:type I restriction enzyme S subunit